MKHFDLFSGYGGFTLALSNYVHNRPAGQNEKEADTNVNMSDTPSEHAWQFTTIGFSEIDKYASAVLAYQYPNVKNYGDITKIDWTQVPDFDLLTGGSPCQDLSIAGKRAGLTGKRSGLFYEFMRAVNEKNPRYFIWENVKGALSSNSGYDFAEVINQMAEAGYALWWQVLNAKDFGVPQNRERIFVIGFRDGSPPEVLLERENCQPNIVVPTLSTRYYGGQANGGYIGHKEEQVIKQLNNPTHSNNRLYGKDGLSPSLNTAQGGNRQPKILDGLMIRDGRDNRSCLRSGRTPELGTTGTSIRRLTPTECERLMGLPDGHTARGILNGQEVEISDSQRYKMCGNGVVVPVVEKLYSIIF